MGESRSKNNVMIWLLCIVGAIILLIVLGLVFDTNPVLIFESIIKNLIQMFIIIGLGNLIGYFMGSQIVGFIIGYLIILALCIGGIVNRQEELEGSVEDYFKNTMRITSDSKVDGWVGITMLLIMGILFVVGLINDKWS